MGQQISKSRNKRTLRSNDGPADANSLGGIKPSAG
jgi:hypothetical protein